MFDTLFDIPIYIQIDTLFDTPTDTLIDTPTTRQALWPTQSRTFSGYRVCEFPDVQYTAQFSDWNFEYYILAAGKN